METLKNPSLPISWGGDYANALPQLLLETLRPLGLIELMGGKKAFT